MRRAAGALGARGFYQAPLRLCYPRTMAVPKASAGGSRPLVKQLVAAGAGSRRRSAALIMEGAVTVNGEPALDLNHPVAPGDAVRVRGVALAAPVARRVYLLLNKPPGYLSAVSDDRGRPTVLDLAPAALRVPGLVPAGRLDLASAGLVLLTNDGDLVNRVTHPRYGVEKEYDVLLDRPLTPAERRLLVAGVEIESGTASAVAVEPVRRASREGDSRGREGPPPSFPRRRESRPKFSPPGGDARRAEKTEPRYRVTLVEGKKREIRLLMAALGVSVLRLTRVRIGGMRLGSLAPGAVRELSAAEARRMLSTGERAHPQERSERQRPRRGRPAGKRRNG